MRHACEVNGCDRPADRLNLCTRHYMRNRRNGDPTKGRTPPGEGERFLRAAVSSVTDECILWPYSVNARTGYGQTRFEGKSATPHRVALYMSTGLRPDRSIHAAHAPAVCHNKLCVNPRHLRWATSAENEADKALDGTKMVGPKVHNSLLTKEQVFKIRSDSRTNIQVARELGVHVTIVENVRYGKTYRSVR